MTTISFPMPRKENERRRALLPSEVALLHNPHRLYFEEGYGEVMGIGDQEYAEAGANVAEHRRLFEHSVVCCMKPPTSEERGWFTQSNQVLFGWIHAVQDRSITDWLLGRKMSAIAWEDMHQDGRHVFWHNNEMAGYAAVVQAALLWGRSLGGVDAALIGRGNTARGAYRALSQLGARVVVYDRATSSHLSEEIGDYDLVVNAVLWDVFRTDHLVSRADLPCMRSGAMIVDVSCDDGMGIETSHSTSIEDPVYEIDGVLHYAVDHSPALFFKDATTSISKAVARYVDELTEDTWGECLKDALIIEPGRILDERIGRFQRR